MLYCDVSELKKYVLQEYLDVVEEKNPGSVEGHLQSVSDEISEAIVQGGYTVPDSNSSPMLTRVCAVMTCYRSIGEITSLMSSEASSNNEWLPLQRLNTKSEKDLDKIREGKLNPFPEVSSGSGISVATPEQIFTKDKWSMY
ncbi:MAG: DUF1320 domain-containing protein [Deltaproteobacteria bacterium]|nr:DUF1320 domain-containing protein [Deltaproteobacteria bacterium]